MKTNLRMTWRALALAAMALVTNSAWSQDVAFVAPPRSIADIAAVLDQQKPNAERVAKLTADAEATPAPNLRGPALGEFLYKRAMARAGVGRTQAAITDLDAAIKAGEGGDYVNSGSRYEQLLIRLLRATGNHKRAIALLTAQLPNFQIKNKGRQFTINLNLTISYLSLGEINRAESFVQRNRAVLAESRNWQNVDLYRSGWAAHVEDGNARIFEARGRYADAEKSYRRNGELMKDSLSRLPQWPIQVPREGFENSINWSLAFEGRAKAKQGRLTEAEADVRRALLSQLSRLGKYHPDTAGILGILAWVIGEQGRSAEAEKLVNAIIEIYQGMNYPEDSPPVVNAQVMLASTMNMQRRYDDVAKIYQDIERRTAQWEPARQETVANNLVRVNALLFAGDTADVVDISRKALEREKSRTGEKSFNTAIARGYLALSLARNGRANEAIAEFRAAIPPLLAATSEIADEDGATVVARESRIRLVVESYLTFLARNPTLAGGEIGEETFRLADLVRGHAVERALGASSARAAANNPALAELVRKEQDIKKQLEAAVGLINNLLAMAPDERDAEAVKATQAQITSLKTAQVATRKDIAKRFPDYAGLIEPPPVSSAEIRGFLRNDEALLSFYFGRQSSFVWAMSKGGPIRFARIAMSSRDIEASVSKLRDALEPQAAMISDIPPFDLTLAYQLYEKLLQPVEAGWKPAKSLVVVTNGALGLLPLSLLPTAPATINTDTDPAFSGYRDVPWLARTHAVTVVPSAGALRTLRRLPAVAGKREQMIGFGDPVFSKAQAAEAVQADEVQRVAGLTTRGMPLRRRSSPQLEGVDSANLAQLPRLPDTAEELKSIALALEVDPAKVLNLRVKANEHTVKTTDLSKYKILVFATHGLVPGELDGLTQPALALSAPDVAGVDGDGILTMEEILALKLNADWVVLSACNTGTGAGAGAEAASGLGRAFFYAGTRALLVTNWSVHSQSARELTTDLFRRQAADAKLTRAEALRQAMVALIDGGGFKDEQGKTVFTYAHPLFWAPYTIIGDGG